MTRKDLRVILTWEHSQLKTQRVINEHIDCGLWMNDRDLNILQHALDLSYHNRQLAMLFGTEQAGNAVGNLIQRVRNGCYITTNQTSTTSRVLATFALFDIRGVHLRRILFNHNPKDSSNFMVDLEVSDLTDGDVVYNQHFYWLTGKSMLTTHYIEEERYRSYIDQMAQLKSLRGDKLPLRTVLTQPWVTLRRGESFTRNLVVFLNRQRQCGSSDCIPCIAVCVYNYKLFVGISGDNGSENDHTVVYRVGNDLVLLRI